MSPRPAIGCRSRGSRGSAAFTRPARSSSSAGRFRSTTPVAREAATGFHARLRELLRSGTEHHDVGPYTPGQAVVIRAARHRGDLPRWLGHIGQGLRDQGPWARPGVISPVAGPGRSGPQWSARSSRQIATSSTCVCGWRGASAPRAGRDSASSSRTRHRPRRATRTSGPGSTVSSRPSPRLCASRPVAGRGVPPPVARCSCLPSERSERLNCTRSTRSHRSDQDSRSRTDARRQSLLE